MIFQATVVVAMAVAKQVAMEVEAAMVEVATVVVAMEEVEVAMVEVATAVADKEVCGRMVRKMQAKCRHDINLKV